MGNESVEASFLSIFALISFFIFLIISKYSHKIKSGLLLDSDFHKPQSFHQQPITRSGGVAVLFSLLIFFEIYYLLFSKVLFDYIFLSSLIFFIGFLDDLKINITPFKRLVAMIIVLFLFVYFFQINILHIDLVFLKSITNNHFLAPIFVLLCLLFIINGANLIDGFNGMLTIHLIIINSILTYINLENLNFEFSFILIGQIIILFSFLLFNFPSAKIFLGDGGAYLLGSLIAFNVITTNNLYSNISSFFYCTLLFYLFFEVFFSFFRKLYSRKSPFYPDDSHLHMLSFYKISNVYGKEKSNFLNSIIINVGYFILILPGIYFSDNPSLSRYWFFILLLIYMFIYSRLYRLTKN
tara:strand:+ start:363 stop:1424 length:1062 start_codon:yes stop_codon:yes gene_type:complete